MSKEDLSTLPTMDEDKLRSSSEFSPPQTAQQSVLEDITTADGAPAAAAEGDQTDAEKKDEAADASDEIVYPGIVTKVGVGVGLALAIFLVSPYLSH
jgi:sorbitol-specific phosphotransferase system component IIBC